MPVQNKNTGDTRFIFSIAEEQTGLQKARIGGKAKSKAAIDNRSDFPAEMPPGSCSHPADRRQRIASPAIFADYVRAVHGFVDVSMLSGTDGVIAAL